MIDTPPNPNSPLTLAALISSAKVYIPTSPELYSFDGMQSLLDLVKRIKKNYNPTLCVGGIFLTKYAKSYRRSLHHQFFDMMQAHPELGPLLMKTSVRENVAIPEAQVQRKSLYEVAPQSNGLQDYEALTQELLSA